jgi:uncharacterized repeat protein (TIGR01451 family)
LKTIRIEKLHLMLRLVLGGLSAFSIPHITHAAGTPAGSTIQNTAQVNYDLGAGTLTTSSNATTVTVAEIINVSVVTLTDTVNVTPSATNQVLQFSLTNTGNGPEQFGLVPNSTLVGDDFDPTLASNRIYFDIDGTPGLSPGDTLYTPGVNDPTLLADASITVLVVNDIPAGLANGATGRSELNATSLTGGVSGTVGQIYAGQGVSGVDAVLGTSAGRATSNGTYISGSILLTLVKSQLITNALGNNQPVPGATITYQIVISPSGTGTADNVVFSDAIPVNTTYVPGSLSFNNGTGVATLTDAADTDAGQFSSAATAQVSVNLGTLTDASAAQTVSFAVTIN